MSVVVAEGEKNRRLVVRFDGAAEGGSPSIPATSRTTSGGPPVLTYVLGGIGVVAMGSFAFFGVTGKNDLHDLRDRCAPDCADDEISKVKREMTVADVSLGIGIVALGAALVTWLVAGPSAAPPTTARW
jgi:hypothetical protein